MLVVAHSLTSWDAIIQTPAPGCVHDWWSTLVHVTRRNGASCDDYTDRSEFWLVLLNIEHIARGYLSVLKPVSRLVIDDVWSFLHHNATTDGFINVDEWRRNCRDLRTAGRMAIIKQNHSIAWYLQIKFSSRGINVCSYGKLSSTEASFPPPLIC